MNEVETTLTYKGRTVEMNDENTAKAMKIVGKEHEQLELNFDMQYSNIALTDAVRGVKTIAKEAIRLGGEDWQVESMLKTLSQGHPIIFAACEAIAEAISD